VLLSFQQYANQSAIKKHIATAHDPTLLKFRCMDPSLAEVFAVRGTLDWEVRGATGKQACEDNGSTEEA
jgi:hypothetical protein